jgi:hypothetical protein
VTEAQQVKQRLPNKPPNSCMGASLRRKMEDQIVTAGR